MRFWTQVAEFARRDLLAERRAREVAMVVIPFGAAALVAVPLLTSGDSRLVARLGTPVFWIVALLFTTQIALRHSASDRVEHREMLSLLGIDPFARLLGRSMASAALIAIFMAILFALMVVFYTPDLPAGWPAALVPMLLAAIGLGLLGTLAAEVTAGLVARAALTALVLVPLAMPLLIGSSQALESLAKGGGILSWTLLVIAIDLALAVTAAAIARPLEEAAR